MQTIELNNLLPHVFRERKGTLRSDVWQRRLTLERGQKYLIEAMSGTGKSSLCAYLIGYRTDYEGTICFDGTPTTQFSSVQWTNLRRVVLSHLFQELRLFPELTALENVEIKNRLTHHKPLSWITQTFERLGIGEKLHAKVGRMSFGQQQRVAFVRALAQPADFLLLDEPVSHLDEGNAHIMADILQEEMRATQPAVVVTSIGKHLPIAYDHTLYL